MPIPVPVDATVEPMLRRRWWRRWWWRRRWRWWRRRWWGRCRRGCVRSLVVGKAAEFTDAPVDRIILAMTPDQRLVLLTEIESQATPNAMEIVLPDLAFCKERSHDAVRHRDTQFAT